MYSLSLLDTFLVNKNTVTKSKSFLQMFIFTVVFTYQNCIFLLFFLTFLSF